jgi:hypothetical protein
VDTAAVHFLQAHSGYQRFVTLGPFAPNYGSYFDVASVNYNDVPASQRWADYVQAHLDPAANPNLFLNLPTDPGIPSLVDELAARLPAYEAVGVKYVLTPPGVRPFAQLPASAQPALVYQDATLWIYQTPAPAPLFSAEGDGCHVQATAWTDASATCATPATLVYRSLADAGWHATVNGHAAPIATYDAVFQRIALPAGRSQVTFWYEPPHATLALLVAGAALLALLGALLLALWLRRTAAHRRGAARGDADSSLDSSLDSGSTSGAVIVLDVVDEEAWARLDLFEDLAEIRADDAQAEQLHRPQEEHHQ